MARTTLAAWDLINGHVVRPFSAVTAFVEDVLDHLPEGDRYFTRQFTLADHVEVKGARFENGLLIIELQREIPEAMKPRRIAINGAPSNVTQIESRAA
ncbi:hypothetical protein ACVWYH_007820 [Bradyrhizobium sp. GM24.11]